MKGKLYGIGVGPGQPGLMTLEAQRLLQNVQVVAYPVKAKGEDGTALEIVRQCVDLQGKRIIELLFDMNPDDEVRKKCRAANIDQICALLDTGQNVAMITLGDVAVYSTYMYLDLEVRTRGYDTAVVPGIPSFCSGAAAARLPLMIGEESLAVVSAAKHSDAAAKALDDFNNVVVMKAYTHIDQIAAMLQARGIPLAAATVMSNVGMADEYIGPLDPARKYGYFTTVLIKKGEKQ